MKLAKLGLYIIFIVFCVACKDEIKVVLPDTYSVEIKQYMKYHDYMVMIYVDSSDCTLCSFKHLIRWYSVKDEFEKNRVGILLIFRNSDERAVIGALKSIGTFHFVFDRGGAFKADNEVFKYVEDNIFVMDKNKNVSFMESPLKNEKTWKSFVKAINTKRYGK
jgi:hypothetical protein